MMDLIQVVGTGPGRRLRTGHAILALSLLGVLVALAVSSSGAGAELDLASVGHGLVDGDGDGYDDTVRVNTTVHNTDLVQSATYTLEAVLEFNGSQVARRTADGLLDPNETVDDLLTLGTDTGSTNGTYTVKVLLHEGDLTGDVVDSDQWTVYLRPRGEYVVSVRANRTAATALENTTVTFTLTVGSASNNPTGVNVTVTTALGWGYELERTLIDLDLDEDATVGLTVTVPPNTPANERETLAIEVFSTRNGTAFATLSVSVTVAKQTFALELEMFTQELYVASGETVTAEGRVRNGGNNLDNVTLMAGTPAGWTAEFVPPYLLVDRGTWRGFVLQLTLPAALKDAGTTHVNVSALSSGLVVEAVRSITIVYNTVELNMTGAQVSITPDPPAVGDELTLQVSFQNAGSVTAMDVLMVVVSDGVELARTTVSDIPPGGTGVATLRWTASPGTQLLRVVADPNNDVPELEEGNNEVAYTLEVTSPDLAVGTRDITLDPGYPAEGSETRVLVNVRNAADHMASPFDVRVTVDGEELDTFTVDTGLAGGSNVTLETTWTAGTGRHEFQVTVDPLGQVPEEDVSNNVATRTFTVNRLPAASLVIHLTSVKEGEPVAMDASGSTDPDGRVRQYFFDYGDGTDSGWVFSAEINHTYGQTGAFEVRVYVRDEAGAQSRDPAVVGVNVTGVDDGNGDDTPSVDVPATVLAMVAAAALVVTLARRGCDGRVA
jgi:uncharacterized membrane protein